MSYEIERPWAQPGYSGKLITTVDINPNSAPPARIDKLIGFTLECLIEKKVTDEQAKRLLTHYDKLKQEGHWIYPG